MSKHMLSHHSVSVNEKLSKDTCAVRSNSNRSGASLRCVVHVPAWHVPLNKSSADSQCCIVSIGPGDGSCELVGTVYYNSKTDDLQRVSVRLRELSCQAGYIERICTHNQRGIKNFSQNCTWGSPVQAVSYAQFSSW